MNEYANIQPPDLPQDPPTPIKPRQQRKRNGCWPAVLVLVIFAGLGIAAGVVVAVVQNIDGSTNRMPEYADDMKDIHEKVILRGDSDQKVVIIEINGIIFPGTGRSRENSPSETIIRQLRKAHRDPDVAAVILDMNTPGGAVTATDEIHHEMQKLRDRGIILLTCMRTIAASGGYYLAAGTDYIIANRLTLTGSIGVIIGGYNYHGLFEKLGVQSEIYKSGKYKDVLNMAREREDEEALLIQELVDETYLEFARIVAEGRDLKLDDVIEGPIGHAGIFSGRQAKELGLVDELGYLEDAISRIQELANAPDARVIRYTQEQTFSDLLFSIFNESVPQMMPGMSGLVKKGQPYYICPTVL